MLSLSHRIVRHNSKVEGLVNNNSSYQKIRITVGTRIYRRGATGCVPDYRQLKTKMKLHICKIWHPRRQFDTLDHI